jgi:hypothetical protein
LVTAVGGTEGGGVVSQYPLKQVPVVQGLLVEQATQLAGSGAGLGTLLRK